MTSVTAYYDGLAFVPVEPVDVEVGTVIQLSVINGGILNDRKLEKAAAFKRLTSELHELNLSDPLTDEFDQILADRVSFSRELSRNRFN
ncbi:MAG: hypothetical protein LBS98_05850 [Coriobacteriales bacterium]|nr:hypothetical protein [Coriobacteriales bacterium]